MEEIERHETNQLGDAWAQASHGQVRYLSAYSTEQFAQQGRFKWDGSSWTIGIANPHEPSAVLTELSLDQGAVATSGGYGYRFDRAGRFTHILDPKTGEPARRWASVTVTSNRATLSDGLSTALSVAPKEMASAVLGGSGRAYLVPFSTETAHWLMIVLATLASVGARRPALFKVLE